MGRASSLGLGLGLAATLFATSAAAHHPVSESGAAWVEPDARLEVVHETARFDVGGRDQGSWQTLSLWLEVPVLPRFSVSAGVPMAYVDFDDGRGVIGLSDIEVSVRGLWVDSPHAGFLLSGGLGTTLPTGRPEDALGAGHLEANAFVMVSSQLTTHLNVYGNVVYKHALGEGMVASEALLPHNPREFELMQGAQWFWTSTAWSELASKQVVSWEDNWGDLMEAGLRAGLGLTDNTRLAVGAWVPVVGTARTSWRLNTSLAYMWP